MPTTVSGELVLSNGALGFQEVLDGFPEAENVWIATYNLSAKDDGALLQALHALPDGAVVEIISNIPNRWESYWSSSVRSKARGSIDRYRRVLDPSSLPGKARTFFNFSNHAKLVATESIAYLGSANYSDESAKNFEAGILIRGEAEVAVLIDEVFAPLRDASIEDVGAGAARVVADLHMYVGILDACDEQIEDAFYPEPDWPARATGRTFVPPTDPPPVQHTLAELCDDVNGVLDQYEIGESARVAINESEVFDAVAGVEDLLEGESLLLTFLKFDPIDHAMRLLAGRHDLYEGELEEAQQAASENASEVLDDLRWELDEADVQGLRDAASSLRAALAALRDRLQSLLSTGGIINNT